jgi:hypothetical protein
MANALVKLCGGAALLIALIGAPGRAVLAADWSMSLSPQFANAISGQTVHFSITFTNALTQSIFFSSFGDGQSITVDLEGNVIGNGVCGPNVDCFVQHLFLTSSDPIEIPGGSPGTTFDLGDLLLGVHQPDQEVIVVEKGGPDSLIDGTFPNPQFAEARATVVISRAPEASATALLAIGLLLLGCAGRRRATRPNPACA